MIMAATVSHSTSNPHGRHRVYHHQHQEQPVLGEEFNQCPLLQRTSSALKHDPGLSINWSSKEQGILETGLAQYSSLSVLVQYIKVAMHLSEKTVRDVALRCRWMAKESQKRKNEDHSFAREDMKKKEKLVDSSTKTFDLASQANLSLSHDRDMTYEVVDGATAELLVQNADAFKQISLNLEANQLKENILLFCQTRDNLFKVVNSLTDGSDVMKRMPALPVKVNEELTSTLLPSTSDLTHL